MKLTKSLLSAVPAVVFAGASLLGAGPVAAAPGPTPNQLTGAANMTNANALATMTRVMVLLQNLNTNSVNGSNGMWCAVYLTNGSTCP